MSWLHYKLISGNGAQVTPIYKEFYVMEQFFVTNAIGKRSAMKARFMNEKITGY